MGQEYVVWGGILLVEAAVLTVLELGTMTGPIPLIDAELLSGVLAELPPVAELDPTTAFAEDDVMDSIIEGADITPEDMPEAIGLDIEPIDETGEAEDEATPVPSFTSGST